MTHETQGKTRVIALIGPYKSGKTSLLESLLAITNTIPTKGKVEENNTVGDNLEEARSHQMGVEQNICSVQYEGQEFVFIDCPGSVEFLQQTYNALLVVDAAIVVVEPQVEKAVALTPYLKYLDDRNIPHYIFINKMDAESPNINDIFLNLQEISNRPLVLRELPIREKKTVVGFVDLVSEKAYKYDPEKPSSIIKIPSELEGEEKEARQKMLETLSEFDDHLLEELINEIEPGEEEIRENFARDLKDDLLVPVVFGGALFDNGTRRLMNILYNEVATMDSALKRKGFEFDASSGVIAEVFHTQFLPYKGKLSYCRVWNGNLDISTTLNGEVAKNLLEVSGGELKPRNTAFAPGSIVALAKFDASSTGGVLSSIPKNDIPSQMFVMPPLYGLAVRAEKRTDELKLNEAMAKLTQQDPSLTIEFSQEMSELVMWGQGDVHLRIAMERLLKKFNVAVVASQPHVPYMETIQGSTKVHGRHKKQSGGHGQFGDVHLSISPLPRGAGFEFHDQITGGVIPKNYIPAVEAGVREALQQGPYGYNVVDVSVSLFDGSYHKVDSSDLAFKTAAIVGMREALPKCEPLLLEPIMKLEVLVPSEIISNTQKLVSSHRGRINGFGDKEGWKHWSTVTCQIPRAELHNFINELRSLSYGLGAFESSFDHLEALTGKLAEIVVEERKKQLEEK